MGAKINVSLHYPYSEEYDYESYLEHINLDREKVKDVTSGNGFIVSSPKAIKDDIKDEYGIFSSKFGQTLQDVNPYGNRYRCKCGAMFTRFNNGMTCPICGTQVKYVDDNFTYFGWIVLKDPYHIIHPNLYMNIASLIGGTTFNDIITPNDKKDEDGNEIEPIRSKDEPYKNIGISRFYELFDEIIDFYVAKRPDKRDHYDLLKENRDKIFIQSIPVYTIHLRPYKLEAGELHYEGNNEIYNMMAHLVAKINDDRYKINRSRSKPKEQLLYNLQMKYMVLDEEINKILSGKKGARVKSLWRTIVKAIVKNFLNCWELSIRDNQQLRLYKRKEMIK